MTNPDTTQTGWIELYCSLNRCLRDLKHDLRAIAKSEDLSINEALLLLCCHILSDEGVPQKRLVGFVAISPAQVSTTIDSLQSRGWVEGYRPSSDRRTQLWRVLTDGETVAERLLAQLQNTSNTKDLRHLDNLRLICEAQVNDLPREDAA